MKCKICYCSHTQGVQNLSKNSIQCNLSNTQYDQLLMLEKFLRLVRTLCMALRIAAYSPVHRYALIIRSMEQCCVCVSKTFPKTIKPLRFTLSFSQSDVNDTNKAGCKIDREIISLKEYYEIFSSPHLNRLLSKNKYWT